MIIEVSYIGDGDGSEERGAIFDALPPSVAVRQGIWHICPGGSKGSRINSITMAIDAPSTAAALAKVTQIVLPAIDGQAFDVTKAIVRIAPYEDADRAYFPESRDGPFHAPSEDYTFDLEDWVEPDRN